MLKKMSYWSCHFKTSSIIKTQYVQLKLNTPIFRKGSFDTFILILFANAAILCRQLELIEKFEKGPFQE